MLKKNAKPIKTFEKERKNPILTTDSTYFFHYKTYRNATKT